MMATYFKQTLLVKILQPLLLSQSTSVLPHNYNRVMSTYDSRQAMYRYFISSVLSCDCIAFSQWLQFLCILGSFIATNLLTLFTANNYIYSCCKWKQYGACCRGIFVTNEITSNFSMYPSLYYCITCTRSSLSCLLTLPFICIPFLKFV